MIDTYPKSQFGSLRVTPRERHFTINQNQRQRILAGALQERFYGSVVREGLWLLRQIKALDLRVDEWTAFTRHFTHLKSGDLAKDKSLLLTTILADAINLSLTKMADSCPGTTYAKLAWLQAWHIRDETYGSALAELVNAQFRHPFAGHWGDGTTSSSNGQNFRTGSKAASTGHVNPKYGSSPGRTFYTHISDQYAPFHTKVVNVGVRDSTYVLDGLLYHESDLRIEEHYTDTAGFTDHVFVLIHILGFRFAPRIRDLGDTKLYIPKGEACNALARAVFFNRLGEIRDRSFEQQRYRASGLNLVTAAIVLWNTVYMGAHQPDRRLPLAQQRQDRLGQVQAATARCNRLSALCFPFSEMTPKKLKKLNDGITARPCFREGTQLFHHLM